MASWQILLIILVILIIGLVVLYFLGKRAQKKQEAQQEQMEAMISRHPRLIFVPAHPGEREYYEKHLDRMKRYSNVYLDLSGTGLFRYGMLREGIRQVGAERFLFGTDYPITNPQMYVHAVLGEHICDRDRELIFHENARRIFDGHL